MQKRQTRTCPTNVRRAIPPPFDRGKYCKHDKKNEPPPPLKGMPDRAHSVMRTESSCVSDAVSLYKNAASVAMPNTGPVQSHPLATVPTRDSTFCLDPRAIGNQLSETCSTQYALPHIFQVALLACTAMFSTQVASAPPSPDQQPKITSSGRKQMLLLCALQCTINIMGKQNNSFRITATTTTTVNNTFPITRRRHEQAWASKQLPRARTLLIKQWITRPLRCRYVCGSVNHQPGVDKTTTSVAY